MRQDGQVRRRYIADRIMLVLLYHPSVEGHLERREGWITLKPSWLARQLKMNSSKLYDQFLFLQEQGYLVVDRQAKWGYVRLFPATPITDDGKPEKAASDYLKEAEKLKARRRARRSAVHVAS